MVPDPAVPEGSATPVRGIPSGPDRGRRPRVWPSADPPDWRRRIRESLPLVAAGAGFLAGAAVASAAHVRLLSSPFPLWIVLALNGVLASAAGTAAVFLDEPDRPIDDDPDTVRVSRVEWEALLRRLESASQKASSRPSAPGLPAWLEGPEPVRPIPPPSPSKVPETPAVPPGATLPAVVPNAQAPEALRREMGLLELQSLGASAVATGENLGTEELRSLIDTSADDLGRIAEVLGAPRRPGESSEALMVRLLRDAPTMERLPVGRFAAEEMRKMVQRLSAVLPSEPIPRGAAPAAEIGSPVDEFDSLLKELESTMPSARRKGAPPPPKKPERSEEDPPA